MAVVGAPGPGVTARRLLALLGRAALATAWGLTVATAPVAVASDAPSEHAVQAAFVFNFLEFVEWPPDAPWRESNEFVIGIVGSSPLEELLPALLEGETHAGLPLAARRLPPGEDPSRFPVLLVAECGPADIAGLVRRLDGDPVLTVGTCRDFVDLRGMIGFHREGNRVRFEVNDTAARRAGLRLSSQLLKLATTVVGGPPERSRR